MQCGSPHGAGTAQYECRRCNVFVPVHRLHGEQEVKGVPDAG